MYIEKVNSPADVKKLSVSEMNGLGGEIRQVLLNKLSSHGGHVGPNLGMVEATIALHYVFDSPTDKIVYDVSHQSYTHKILTGRRAAFPVWKRDFRCDSALRPEAPRYSKEGTGQKAAPAAEEGRLPFPARSPASRRPPG